VLFLFLPGRATGINFFQQQVEIALRQIVLHDAVFFKFTFCVAHLRIRRRGADEGRTWLC
jgi:hypothetical protein